MAGNGRENRIVKPPFSNEYMTEISSCAARTQRRVTGSFQSPLVLCGRQGQRVLSIRQAFNRHTREGGNTYSHSTGRLTCAGTLWIPRNKKALATDQDDCQVGSSSILSESGLKDEQDGGHQQNPKIKQITFQTKPLQSSCGY